MNWTDLKTDFNRLREGIPHINLKDYFNRIIHPDPAVVPVKPVGEAIATFSLVSLTALACLGITAMNAAHKNIMGAICSSIPALYALKNMPASYVSIREARQRRKSGNNQGPEMSDPSSGPG